MYIVIHIEKRSSKNSKTYEATKVVVAYPSTKYHCHAAHSKDLFGNQMIPQTFRMS